MKNNIIVSPSINSDWNFFLGTSPDVTAMRDWVIEHFRELNFEESIIKCDHRFDYPDEVFPTDVLDDWAKDNDYVKDISDFNDEEISKYVRENLSPTEVYGDNFMLEWVKENIILSK